MCCGVNNLISTFVFCLVYEKPYLHRIMGKVNVIKINLMLIVIQRASMQLLNYFNAFY